MEANTEDHKNNGEDLDEMNWTNVKHFQHRYLVRFPKKLKKDVQVQIELPYPIFDPLPTADHGEYKKLFITKSKLDTHFKFYRKLHSRSNINLLKKDIDKNEFVSIPQYVVDVASDAFQNEHPAWYYISGTLDCFSFKNAVYVARSDANHTLHITENDVPSNRVSIELHEPSPVYGLKTHSYGQDALIALRQKCGISLFHVFDSVTVEANFINKWEISNLHFIDMNFNKFKKNQISFIDSDHNFKIRDFIKNEDIINYKFPKDSNALTDCFAQIDYFDCNTVCFMNRSYILLLDLRSRAIQKSCYTKSWLKCDDLCTFSRNKEDTNSIYVASMHNATKFDVRSLNFSSKIAHMLSTPPFMSSSLTTSYGDYVCLFGQDINDKILLHNHVNLLNIPQYIPNTKNTLTVASVTSKTNFSDHLEERLSLPIIGMKLYSHDTFSNAVLYTSNSIGDVFKQNILQTRPISTDAISKLAAWVNILPSKPKVVNAIGVCNLTNVRHSVYDRFPKDKNIIKLMKKNDSQKLFDKNVRSLMKQLEGNVGEAMNAIWTDEKVITEADDSGISSAMSAKHKVSKWLDSVL